MKQIIDDTQDKAKVAHHSQSDCESLNTKMPECKQVMFVSLPISQRIYLTDEIVFFGQNFEMIVVVE